MASAGDNLVLMLLAEIDEAHGIAENADGKIGILVRVSLGITQEVSVENRSKKRGAAETRPLFLWFCPM